MAVVLSPALVTNPALTDQPLFYPRIGWQKITGTISASSASAGYPAANADDPLTYNYWKPTALTATWEIDASQPTEANYIGIAAHTCGTDQATVTAQYWDGSAWQTLASSLPASGDDSPIMFLFGQQNATKYRISLSGSTAPRIGVIYVGKTLDMPRGLAGGQPLITMQRKTTIQPNVSESGQFIGRSITRGGSTATYNFEGLNPDWYRSDFDPFVESARTDPFFIAWNPVSYTNEIGYVWTNQDIRPSFQGSLYLQVGFSVEGLGVD